jgi:hypothetical protein
MPPRRVILTMFALVLLLHGYIGLRLVPDLPAGGRVFALFLALSALLAPSGLLARAIAAPQLSRTVSWLGLSLLGGFSCLLCLTVLRDVLLLAVMTAGGTSTALPGISAEAVIGLSAALVAVGFVNARRLARTVEVRVELDGLAPQLDGLRIVQISDIHVGPTVRRAYLQRIVDRVNRLDADVVAITGDVVDGSVRQLAAQTAPLQALRARLGVFLVTGNHEYYSGAQEWVAEFRRLGLTVLENSHVLVGAAGQQLLIAGVNDYSAGHFAGGGVSDPAAALGTAPPAGVVRILLAHQPRSAPAARDAGFDLQLSGHTHGGQFVPWNFFVPLQQPFVAGLARLGSLQVYTSRGTGYWGPPLRLWAPAEITVLRLAPARR